MSALFLWLTSSALGRGVVKWAAIGGTVVAILFAIRKSGKESAKIDALESQLLASRKAKHYDDQVDELASGAALDELRRNYSRKS